MQKINAEILYLIKKPSYNNVLKKYSHKGSEGKKLGEKLAENLTKSAPKISQKFPKPKSSQPTKLPEKNINVSPTLKPQAVIENKLPKVINSEKPYEVKINTSTFLDNISVLKPIKPPVIDNNEIAIQSNGIPLPPPLPSKPLVKPKKIDVESITPQALQKAKDNLKCQYNIPLNTKIKDNGLDIDEIFKEAYLRGLVKNNENFPKDSKFDTIDGDQISVANSLYPIKITPLGQAHLKNIEKISHIKHDLQDCNENEYDYKLAIIKPNNNLNTLILSGKENHIISVIVVNKNTNDTYIMGILTSKKIGEEISSYQYIDFQKKKNGESLIPLDKQKTQNYITLDQFEKINKENLYFLKWGEEFIKTTRLKNILPAQKDIIIKEPARLFIGGYTKENIIDICINFDNKINNKEPEPKTQPQILQGEKAIDKQKKMKEENLNNNSNNNNNEEL